MIYNSTSDNSNSELSATLAVKLQDRRHTLYLQIIVASAFVALIVFLSWGSSVNKATLILDLTSGHRTFQGQVVTGMTVFDALKLALDAGSLELKVKEDPDAPRVFVIDTRHPTSIEEVSKVMVNSHQVTVGQMSSLNLNPGDRILVVTKGILE